jgi:stage V sporulation protein SpoVS
LGVPRSSGIRSRLRSDVWTLGCDAAAQRARDLPVARLFFVELVVQPVAFAELQMDQIGDHAVAEQRDLVAVLVVVGIVALHR